MKNRWQVPSDGLPAIPQLPSALPSLLVALPCLLFTTQSLQPQGKRSSRVFFFLAKLYTCKHVLDGIFFLKSSHYKANDSQVIFRRFYHRPLCLEQEYSNKYEVKHHFSGIFVNLSLDVGFIGGREVVSMKFYPFPGSAWVRPCMMIMRQTIMAEQLSIYAFPDVAFILFLTGDCELGRHSKLPISTICSLGQLWWNPPNSI